MRASLRASGVHGREGIGRARRVVLANLVTYPELADRILNDTIDMLKMIHEMTYLKLKKDTKYSPDDKIFNKIFFLLSYSRYNLNCLLNPILSILLEQDTGT